MQSNVRRMASFALAGIVVVSLLAALMGSQQAAAQTLTGEGEAQRVIHVGGDGTVAARPDVAVVSVGVETLADTAAAALSQNSQQVQSLIAALTQGGVTAENIQTQQVQLYPRYEDVPPTPVPPAGEGTTAAATPAEPRLLGYTATNIVEVRISDVTRVGDLLDAAVSAGGNRIQGIRFEVSDPAAALDRAREAAWEDALHKGTRLAELAGASLGDVISISESSQSPVPVLRDLEVSIAAPIQPGTQNIQVHLEVTWELRGGFGTMEGAEPPATFEPTAPPPMTPTMTPTTPLTDTGALTSTETMTGTLPTIVPMLTPTPTAAVEPTDTLTLTLPGATEVPTLPVLTLDVTPTVQMTATAVMPPALQVTPVITATGEMTGTALGLPNIEITPTFGAPGTAVQVTLSGFPSNTLTVVRLGIINAIPGVRRVMETDVRGSLTTTLMIPRNAQRGEQWSVVAFTDDGRAAAMSRIFRVR